MTFRHTFWLVVGVVALTAFTTHEAQADRVAIGNTAGGVSTFDGDPSNLSAGPADCCFLTDGQITVEWLDFDNLAIGSHSAANCHARGAAHGRDRTSRLGGAQRAGPSGARSAARSGSMPHGTLVVPAALPL